MLSPDEVRQRQLEHRLKQKKKQKLIMFAVGGGAVLLLAAILIIHVVHPGPLNCTDRGVKFYKDMGSYPKLSDGRFADVVISEMCANAPDTAFKSPGE